MSNVRVSRIPKYGKYAFSLSLPVDVQGQYGKHARLTSSPVLSRCHDFSIFTMNPIGNNDGRPETDADLFEKAVFKILAEDFPGRLRSSLNEEETWKLHRAASYRVFCEFYGE
jgi:hypothetical protein